MSSDHLWTNAGEHCVPLQSNGFHMSFGKLVQCPAPSCLKKPVLPFMSMRWLEFTIHCAFTIAGRLLSRSPLPAVRLPTPAPNPDRLPFEFITGWTVTCKGAVRQDDLSAEGGGEWLHSSCFWCAGFCGNCRYCAFSVSPVEIGGGQGLF